MGVGCAMGCILLVVDLCLASAMGGVGPTGLNSVDWSVLDGYWATAHDVTSCFGAECNSLRS